jgi:RNA polymerase sigma factor (sigma-70 family)
MTKEQMGDAIIECINFLYDYQKNWNLTDDDIQDVCEKFTLTYQPNKGTTPRTWATYLAKQHLYIKNRPAQKRTGTITRLDTIVDADDFHSALHHHPTNEMEEAETNAMIVATVQHFLKKLTPKQEQAIRLVMLEGKNLNEAATELGISRQGVHNLITTGIHRMQKHNKIENPFQ